MAEQKEGLGSSIASPSHDTATGGSLALPSADHTREQSAVYFHLTDYNAAARSSTTTAASIAPPSVDKTLAETTSTTTGVEMESFPSSPTAANTLPSPKEGIYTTSSLSSLTEKVPANSCIERREGWNRGQTWSTLCFLQGIIFWVLALIIPGVVMILMKQKVCDQLCIPAPDAGAAWVQNLTNPADWKINNFLTNSNRSWWPQEYFNIYLYHINNSDAVVAGKESKLKVQVVGPYVFNTYRYKYNTSFSADYEQIFYKQGISYIFNAGLSGGRKLTDVLTTVNMPLVSINWMEWTVAGMPMLSITDFYCSSDKTGAYNSCLFEKKLTVQQILFGQAPTVYQLANVFMYNVLAPTFQLFFNYSTVPAIADSQHLVSSYGLGGKVHPYTGRLYVYKSLSVQALTNFNFTYGRPTGSDSLLSSQYTGQGGSYSNLYGFTQFKGNTSLTVWNGPEQIQGTDHFQFTPPVTPYSRLTVWDDDVMRSVDLKFKEKVSVIDTYDAYRFTPSDLFSGTDPHYGGQPGFEGLLSVSPVSQIHYGALAPAYASRPFLAGVNSTLANTVICLNCPDMTNPADWLDIYVDVEPNTGKVLGGSKRGQINALVGQPYIYKNATFGGVSMMNLSLALVPVVYFEYTQEVEVGPQTDQLDDGLDQVKLARVATATIFYLVLPLSVIAFMISFVVALKADDAGACCAARGPDTSGLPPPYSAK